MFASDSRELKERTVHCPYCGEPIEILVDATIAQQDYIEDCQVCCRPISIEVSVDPDGDARISVANENE